jgi:predicted dienelactone hydrolase
VGHLVTEASYTDALGEPRTIRVLVWYPTEATEGGEVRYDSIFIQPSVLGDAAPAAPVHDGGYPTIVHSHGAWGVAGGAGYWGERLVSQGWVLIAPEHAGDTFSDGFPNFSGTTPSNHYIHRPQDMTAALDHVAGAGLLAGDLRTDAVALSGHSRGAYTAWASSGGTFDADIVAAACAGEQDFFPSRSCTPEEQAVFTSGALDEPRVQASLVLDGGIRSIFGDEGHRSVHAPFFVMRKVEGSGSDQAEYDRMDGVDYTWVSVEGACHETFNVGVEASTQAPCETFEQQRGWDMTATYAAAFFRRALLGDEGEETVGIVEGTIEVDPAVTLQAR